MRALAFVIVAGAILAGCSRTAEQDPRQPSAAGNSAAPADKTAAKPPGLPLEVGYFVRLDLDCGAAAADSLWLHTGEGLSTENLRCSFRSVTALEDGTYEVVQDCVDSGSGSTNPVSARYTIKGPMEYQAVDEDGWEYGAKFCAQSSLPAPWNTREIDARTR